MRQGKRNVKTTRLISRIIGWLTVAVFCVALFGLGPWAAYTCFAQDRQIRALQAETQELRAGVDDLNKMLMVGGAIALQTWSASLDPNWPDLYNEMYWDKEHPMFKNPNGEGE